MKIELTEQDIKNTIFFLGRSRLEGTESLAHAVLMQTYQAALQPKPSEDGAREEEIPAKS